MRNSVNTIGKLVWFGFRDIIYAVINMFTSIFVNLRKHCRDKQRKASRVLRNLQHIIFLNHYTISQLRFGL